MRTLALLGAALLAGSSAASAAPVVYGVSFIGTDFSVDLRETDYFRTLPRDFAGTFTFDEDANQLLAFNAFYAPDYSISPLVVGAFNAAGPCNVACFTSALETGSFTYNYDSLRATITFGDPLNATVVRTTPAFSVRPIIASGVIRVNGAIPEPGTWALMLLGFGAIGASMRHQAKLPYKKPYPGVPT